MSKKLRKFVVFLLVLTTIFSLTVVDAKSTDNKQSEADYANFRNVRAGTIGLNNLYRSQHPANGSARSIYANKLAKKYGIQTVVNLSDSKSIIKKYFKKKKIGKSYYYRTLYNKGRVYTAHIAPKYRNSTYRKKITRALKFMARHKGPYLIHCEVGRDRTGFVILLLESLMGASYDYMLNDYAISYINVNHYSSAKARSKAIKYTNKDFSYMTGKNIHTNWRKVPLNKSAENFLRKGGMTWAEISALKKNLSASYPSQEDISNYTPK